MRSSAKCTKIGHSSRLEGASSGRLQHVLKYSKFMVLLGDVSGQWIGQSQCPDKVLSAGYSQAESLGQCFGTRMDEAALPPGLNG